MKRPAQPPRALRGTRASVGGGGEGRAGRRLKGDGAGRAAVRPEPGGTERRNRAAGGRAASRGKRGPKEAAAGSGRSAARSRAPAGVGQRRALRCFRPLFPHRTAPLRPRPFFVSADARHGSEGRPQLRAGERCDPNGRRTEGTAELSRASAQCRTAGQHRQHRHSGHRAAPTENSREQPRVRQRIGLLKEQEQQQPCHSPLPRYSLT